MPTYLVFATLILLILGIGVISINPKLELSRNKTPSVIQENNPLNNNSQCWAEDTSWINNKECEKIRSDTFLKLADIEESRNKLTLVQKSSNSNLPKTYISKRYNFKINYPADWFLEQHDAEGIETISIIEQNSDSKKRAEITIGTGQVYSTSGALCANQGCDYDAGTVSFINNFSSQLTKSYIWVNDENGVPVNTEVENYRFSLPLQKLLPKNQNESYLYITATIFDQDDGEQVLSILATFE